MARGGRLDRRTLLGLSSSAAIAAALRGATPALAAGGPHDEILIGGNFKVDIEGCPRSSAFSVSAAIGRMRTNSDHDRHASAPSRSTKPQPMTFDESCFTFLTPVVGRNDDLARWMDTTVAGKVDRRRIVVSILSQDGSVGRSYNLVDCFPLSFDGGDFTTGAESNLAELRVQPTRVEIA
jgi:hypothetical protein